MAKWNYVERQRERLSKERKRLEEILAKTTEKYENLKQSALGKILIRIEVVDSQLHVLDNVDPLVTEDVRNTETINEPNLFDSVNEKNYDSGPYVYDLRNEPMIFINTRQYYDSFDVENHKGSQDLAEENSNVAKDKPGLGDYTQRVVVDEYDDREDDEEIDDGDTGGTPTDGTVPDNAAEEEETEDPVARQERIKKKIAAYFDQGPSAIKWDDEMDVIWRKCYGVPWEEYMAFERYLEKLDREEMEKKDADYKSRKDEVKVEPIGVPVGTETEDDSEHNIFLKNMKKIRGIFGSRQS